jgi:hypothetical protein
VQFFEIFGDHVFKAQLQLHHHKLDLSKAVIGGFKCVITDEQEAKANHLEFARFVRPLTARHELHVTIGHQGETNLQFHADVPVAAKQLRFSVYLLAESVPQAQYAQHAALDSVAL